MARARLDPADETVTLRIRVPAAERDRLKEAAAKFGKPMAEFVRLVLLAAAKGATTPQGVITLPDEQGRPRNPPPRRPGPVPNPSRSKVLPAAASGSTGRIHKAGAMLSGGIHPCIEKGCMARKILGSWVEEI